MEAPQVIDAMCTECRSRPRRQRSPLCDVCTTDRDREAARARVARWRKRKQASARPAYFQPPR